ncbi:MAG TPA: hypothetical protein PLB10_03035 [Thiolinea sp.]|nr:hypothetical protein [Thiolinea sp.]
MVFPFAHELRWLLWGFLLPAGVAHVLAGWYWAMPFWLGLVLVLFISRTRIRAVEADPLALYAPLDGVVESVESGVLDPWHERDGPACRIRLRQYLRGEYVLLSPTEGRCLGMWWPGKEGTDSRSFGFVVRTDEGDACVINVLEAAPPRFKTHRVSAGSRIRQGGRFGLVGPGVVVDVYLDDNVTPVVNPGTRVTAGMTALAELRGHR